MTMRVVGIDPGLAATGVAVVEGTALCVAGYSFGTIRTSADCDLPQRLKRIYDGVTRAIQEMKPDIMVVEDVFSLDKHPKSGITLGKVTGVILLAACHSSLPIMEVAVREAKRVLTGSGSAGKIQLEICVRARLDHPEPIKPSHASDALALALVGLYRSGTTYDRLP
jgi:crossover junction endodeoxyribonuclease RuvC